MDADKNFKETVDDDNENNDGNLMEGVVEIDDSAIDISGTVATNALVNREAVTLMKTDLQGPILTPWFFLFLRITAKSTTKLASRERY